MSKARKTKKNPHMGCEPAASSSIGFLILTTTASHSQLYVEPLRWWAVSCGSSSCNWKLFDPAPFAVIINRDRFSTCRFQLSETQSVYSLTQQSSESIPIQCNSQTQISGARDLIEYPIQPQTPIGSIKITSAIEEHLCVDPARSVIPVPPRLSA